jgi:hypothetical protein
MCTFHAGYIPGELNNRALKAETDPEKRDLFFPYICDTFYHTFDTALTETARHKDTVDIAEKIVDDRSVRAPPKQSNEFYPGIIGSAGMHECFADAFIRVGYFVYLPQIPMVTSRFGF